MAKLEPHQCGSLCMIPACHRDLSKRVNFARQSRFIQAERYCKRRTGRRLYEHLQTAAGPRSLSSSRIPHLRADRAQAYGQTSRETSLL